MTGGGVRRASALHDEVSELIGKKITRPATIILKLSITSQEPFSKIYRNHSSFVQARPS
ncbi:hypothetical protein PGT21_024686 [Puccinia graminis f. sp. tritici]|uniref:Uncharacterized protein n=1 Tax=Puccinia graminis f. sp. tritici TaxID=56615 RepID=A0A5B0R6H0_PUCGR|nr:hypothetical protein PGT21_024686 [Puccinia graminis f. sp. tritici]KAA1120978.1 hypothetical protein PGTUg99_024435 [Puccinia graminis f. sp. tritici]